MLLSKKLLDKKLFLIFFIILNLLSFEAIAQESQNKKSQKKIAKLKSFARKNYREVQISYSLMSDKFGLDLNGTKGSLRAQFQGINLFYVFQNPGQNTKILYNYGFGITAGTVKALSTAFAAEAKDKPWFMGTFAPGIDFRNGLRSRIGFFMPISFRPVNFDFDEELEVKKDDQYSFGFGGRYVNAVSIKDSFSFSFTHQVIWQSTSWELSWQHRLGL